MSDREPIPDPRTPEQTMLGLLARRQDETNDLLQQILNRLPAPPPERADGTVELREPKPPATSPGGEKREPAGGGGSPRPAPRRQTPKKK